MSLTVLCVLVRGHVDFTPEYVRRLFSMVSRHLRMSFKFVCLTDQPQSMPPGVLGLHVEPYNDCFAWWTKIQLFNPALPFAKGSRLLYLDLDTLVVDSLAPIVNYSTEFAIIPDAGTFQGRNGLQVIKAYNSSVMTWNHRCDSAQRIFSTWHAGVPLRLWGDQDHIADVCPWLQRMPIAWFPRLSELRLNGSPPDFKPAKVVLCKKPKNEVARTLYPWFDELWQ